MENKGRKLLRPADAAILFIMLILAAGIYALTRSGGDGCGTAVISVDGVTASKISLDKYGVYTFPEIPGTTFTVENGAVSISENDCPDLVCVRTGAISQKSEAIICLPKKLAVTIEDAPDNGIDAVMR